MTQLKVEPIEVVHVGPFTTAKDLERWYEQRLEERGMVSVTRQTMNHLAHDAMLVRTTCQDCGHGERYHGGMGRCQATTGYTFLPWLRFLRCKCRNFHAVCGEEFSV